MRFLNFYDYYSSVSEHQGFECSVGKVLAQCIIYGIPLIVLGLMIWFDIKRGFNKKHRWKCVLLYMCELIIFWFVCAIVQRLNAANCIVSAGAVVIYL